MLKNYVQTGTVTKGKKGVAGFLSMVPQGALHTAQPCFIFCGIAAKCFINPRQGYAAKFTDLYRRLQARGHKETCLYLSGAKHKLFFFCLFCQNPFFFRVTNAVFSRETLCFP